MAFVPIANIAQRNVNAMADPRDRINAIVASTPALVQQIAAQSGAAPGANPFAANLYTGAESAAADKAYAEALTRALPRYVNAYRAYQEEQKKKTGGAGGAGADGGYTQNYGQTPTLPPVSTYIPQAGFVPDVVRDQWYGTSPYGAMPLGSISKTKATQPAARVLAQRRAAAGRVKAMAQ